jgi:primosomal protein N' (replication factor Y)
LVPVEAAAHSPHDDCVDDSNSRQSFVEVAVNSGQAARMAFTYAVPEGIQVSLGQAVFVPFGPRVLQGIVIGLSDASELENVRPLNAVAGPQPAIDVPHIALARWMSDTYLAPIWDCVAVSLPSGYGQRALTMVSPVDIPPLFPVYPKDRRVLHYIGAHGQVSIDNLRAHVGTVSMDLLDRLQREGHITVAQGLARPAGRERFQRRIRLLRTAPEALLKAEEIEAHSPRSVEARVLRLLAKEPDRPLSAIREAGGAPRHLSRLADDSWLEDVEVQVERDPLAAFRFEPRTPPALTASQQVAVDEISLSRGEYLLHGVTGSGKTEVYLDLVGRALAAGQGAIVLVPEIALTPQAIRRYGERFGHTLTVFHSALNTGELYDQWHKVERGDARLVVGSRSALFAPVKDLGLVVIDEEHENSYKQDSPQPRYHARETARELCRISGATLVLGSATPDIITYHRTESGLSKRVSLRDRVIPGENSAPGVSAMPHVFVTDMREELKTGNRGMFSRGLARAVKMSFQRGEQSILFINRRGSARFLLCRACGYVAKCSTCQCSLSLDATDPDHLREICHNCSRSRKLDDECPQCGSNKYRPFGVGTQRVEQEARIAFPGARVVRWDSDSASKKGSHQEIVRALEAGEIDILVGTQVIAKGLDLPAMNVVGVVDADVGLSLPQYNAHERAFQLLSQVGGRAGRRGQPGQVFIQTYQPEAVPIVCAAAHDYEAFYEHEIAHRRRAGYPPFSRLVRLVHQNRQLEPGLQEASRIASALRLRRDTAGRAEPDVLGPAVAFIPRMRGMYRWQILLRGRDPASLVANEKLGPGWTVDVDPVNLL